MKLTKEEALKRLKNALDRKKAWEEKFDAKYAGIKKPLRNGIITMYTEGTVDFPLLASRW